MIEPQPNRAFAWTQAPWGSALVCTRLPELAAHLFTTGNLELRNDQREWTAVANAMGVPASGVRLIRQVHGTGVAVARESNDGWNRPEADIVITSNPEVAIAVRVADCAPILLVDRRLHAVGAVHAGWRGTMQRAAAEGVAALTREFGSRPEDLVAAIGPCLGPCCGEVGDEVVGAFRSAGHPETDLERWFRPGARARPYLDLWRANRDQLAHAGIPEEHIHVAELCTKTHPLVFHSYRVANTAAGRMLGIVRVRRP